jgi:hypothetical protein
LAKETRGFKATNAMLDVENMKLIEYTKDGTNVYLLNKILQEWNGVDGISFSITLNQEVEPDETEY